MRTLAAISFFCILACGMALNYYNPSIIAGSPLTYAINEPVTYVKRYAAAPAISYVAPAAPITTTYIQKAAAPIAYTYGSPYAYGYGDYGYGSYGYPLSYYKK